MAIKDLHLLPRVEDGWSFLYVQHCRVEQDGKSISVWEETGHTAVPCAALSLLMLGPGTAITHAAVRTLGESGCMILWCGEEGVRVYGVGLGETRSSRNVLRQAARGPIFVLASQSSAGCMPTASTRKWTNPFRCTNSVSVRGFAFARAMPRPVVSAVWNGKGETTTRTSWKTADPVNRALSCANSCLYGLCHAAIVAAGYSPAIGFVHSGKALSFVYDVADLYKTITSIPAAFGAVHANPIDLEGTVRRVMRDMFFEERLLERILPDLNFLFEGFGEGVEASLDSLLDSADGLPSGLWDPEAGSVGGGVNYSEETNGSNDPGTGSA